MSQFAIRADVVSKRYHVGARPERYQLLRDRLSALGAAPFRRWRTAGVQLQDHFWALDQVSFEIAPGEVVGVIGANGAGKSTLLKVLSRITEPTSGRIDIVGRIGSLLEVGTGFHQELTGRENVYLNGAILGMRRREVDRKFDEMVSFAEVEKFIDTPVKHYSSGMYLRLAFAVAAHLDPEILLVDEVLAVGDIAFQKKCLAKMNAVAKLGQTVLFVSHNLGAIKDLCTSCVVLEAGKVKFRGRTLEGLGAYANLVMSGESNDAVHRGVGWSQVRLECDKSTSEGFVTSGEPFTVLARLSIKRPLESARLACVMDSSSGDGILHSEDATDCPLTPGQYEIRAIVPPLWLAPDGYTLRFKYMGWDSERRFVRAISDPIMIDMRYFDDQAYLKVRTRLVAPLQWSVNTQQCTAATC